MENKNTKFDLEDRLVDFACMCLEVCELLPSSKAGQNIENQNFEPNKNLNHTHEGSIGNLCNEEIKEEFSKVFEKFK